ncbi:uncharacterized protein LOC125814980 [Solanum verrucosum]|uniref:uncharacterized protein LOC125814980 n=1 Tax=Solanum verrucosum TaxID=315347 RepID=UPI0020D16465|nr:uncharacterized protein LOC125814980 [Solanum verrucosum]
MMNISILLRHSGIWASEVNYEGYKSNGIVVGQSISFLNLKAAISVELEINEIKLVVRYIALMEHSKMKVDPYHNLFSRFMKLEEDTFFVLRGKNDKNVTDMHLYCFDYYKPDALEKHKVQMVPMPDKEDWSVPSNVIDETVWPPRYKRLAGRSRKRRKKMQMKR